VAELAPGRPEPPDLSADAVWFDATRLGLEEASGAAPAGGLVVRPHRPGERMVPFGGVEAVRVTKLLAGAGVPRLARARWPVVARGDEVLWLVGVRRSAAAPLTGETRRALRLGTVPDRPSGLPVGDTV
jgi:tRNA(Ile)-lysidine synthetase-like protein